MNDDALKHIAEETLQRVLREINGAMMFAKEDDCEAIGTFIAMNIVASMLNYHISKGRHERAALLEAYVRQSLDEAIEAAKKGYKAHG